MPPAVAAAVSVRAVPVRRVAARGVGRLRGAVPLPFDDPAAAPVSDAASTAVSGAGSVMVLLGRVIDTVLLVRLQYRCRGRGRYQQ